MSDTNKEVGNEYGMSEEEYAKERKAIRASLKNGTDLEVTPIVDQGTAQQPAAEAAAAEEVEEESKDKGAAEIVETETPETKKEEDPLAGLPDEWKEKVASQLKAAKDESEYQKKRYTSDIGRINAYQSKYEEIRRELEAKQAEIAALKKAPPKALKELNSPRIKQALESGEEDLVELMEETRNATRLEMQEEIKALEARLQQQLTPIHEQRQDQAVQEFDRKLSDRWQNWREVVYQTDNGRVAVDADNNPIFSEGWATYINDQPSGVRQAITNVTSAEDAIWAIENYERWLKQKGYVTDEAEEKTPAATIPNAEAIQKKREADLRRKAPPTGKQVALQPTPTLDMNNEDMIKKARALARKAIQANDPSIYSTRNL